ncbi:MAG: hypothetical protein PVG60_04275 [Desulfarculaceae bacterium]|jgi:hypothetical protein
MSKAKMWIGVIAVFVVGMVIGAFVGSLLERQLFISKFEHFRRERRGPIVESMLEKLSRRLDLTPEQSRKIKPVLEKGFRQMMEIHREVSPRFEKVFKENHLEIKKHLTKEQQKKLEEFFNRRPFKGGPPFLMPPPPGPPGPGPGPGPPPPPPFPK